MKKLLACLLLAIVAAGWPCDAHATLKAVSSSGSGGGGGTPSIGGAITGGTNGDFLGVSPASTIAQFAPITIANIFNGGSPIDPRDPIYGTNTCTGYYTLTGSTLNSGGTGYAVNDKFTVTSTIAYGLIIANLATGHVTSVSGGVVTGYTLDTLGGGYSTATAQPTVAVTGSGSGLTINITSIGTGNDDTAAIHNAIAVASVTGAVLKAPNGCWIQNENLIAGTSGLTIDGGAFDVDYGYDYQPMPRWFIIGHPNFGINLNGASSAAFHGFEITGIYDSSAFGDTSCIGSTTGTPGYPQGKIWLDHISMKGCNWGYHPAGGYVYTVISDSDYSANNHGVGGTLSDFYSRGDTCASTSNQCIDLGSGNGQFTRIDNLRCEYGTNCITGNSAYETQLVNVQSDHMNGCAITLNSWGRYTITAGSLRGSGLNGSLVVTGAANNGSGLIRLTVTGANGTGGFSTGATATVAGVTGTTEANGFWTVTVVDSTHIDLQSSSFTNAYSSGGFVGVSGNDADVCITGGGTGFHAVNVDYENGSAVGYNASPAYLVDTSASGVANVDMISGQGGNAASGYASYNIGVANWETFGAPANTHIEIGGSPLFRNDTTSGSIGATGNVGIGTTSPSANAILDLGSATNALILPSGTVGQRPTPTAGMVRYNSSTPGLEAYYSSAWNALGTGTSVTWPTTGDVVVSNASNSPAGIAEVDGDCIVGTSGSWGAGSCAGSSSINLGTSTSAASPQISGDATSGLYTAGAGKVDVVISGSKINEWTSTGASLTGTQTITSTSASALIVGANGATNPVLQVDDSTASVVGGIAIKGASVNLTTSISTISSGNTNLLISATSGSLNLNTSSQQVNIQQGGNTQFALSYGESVFQPTAYNGAQGTTAHLIYTQPADNTVATGEANIEYFNNAANSRKHGTGSYALQRDFYITGETDTFSAASTVTDMANLGVDYKICGTNGTCTNESAIYVPTKALTGAITNSYGLNVAAASGATNNYAALFTGPVIHTATITTGGYTVSTLPSGTVGMRAYVTDQTTACPAAGGALTGGGSVVCPVFFNSSSWVGD